MTEGDGSEDRTRPPDDAATRPNDPASTTASRVRGYDLGKLLGKGGMGEVVLARDTRFDRDVALKRMLVTTPSQEVVDRFLREAKIQARLDHPAIVPVHDLGYDADGAPYFTMKRLAGTTLSDVLAGGTATGQRLLRAFVDVCLAIDLAHARRVVHRDLKPANIMLGDYGEVYVLDWGIARVLERPDRSSAEPDSIGNLGGETHVGALLGTPGYMAPEQVRGDAAGPAADIYALGAILFEIVAGEPVHPRGDAALAATATGDYVRSPIERAPERAVAPELDALCTAALADDAARRPTARALADGVQRYLDGDRDLAQRQRLAAEALARALVARDAGDRGTAVHEAGRAVALDPSSRAAVDLLTVMIVEPPKELPGELARAIAAEDVRLRRLRSRSALLPWLSFFAATPFFMMIEVASWPRLVSVYIAIALQVVLTYVNWRVRAVPVGVMAATQLVTVVAFTQMTGPFVIAPLIIAAILVSVTTFPWFTERRWAVAGWAITAAGAPLALEVVGVFPRAWIVSGSGITTHGSVFISGGSGGAGLLIAGSIAAIVVVAFYTLGVARDRRDAQHSLMIQAWHLRQLLPRAAIASP